MFLRIRHLLWASCACVLSAGAVSCITPDYTLGQEVIPKAERFITRTVTIPISDIEMGTVDSLTGYSTVRMAVGSLRDETFGLVRRNAAVALVPVSDEVKWGHNVKIQSFNLYALKDTTSYIRPEDERIIQNFGVYALTQPLDSSVRYSCDKRFSREVAGKGKSICIGTPSYNGGDSLVLKFTKEFAATYIPAKAFEDGDDVTEAIDTLLTYKIEHPGIFICCEDPVGIGGRSNFFDVALETDSNNYVTAGFAQLNFTADFGSRTQVDTAVLFSFTPSGLSTESLKYYAFNSCEHDRADASQEVKDILAGKKVKDKLYVEGGVGIKPWIKAKSLRKNIIDAVRDTLVKYNEELVGPDPTDAVLDSLLAKGNVMVNQCRIIMPYEYDSGNWEYYSHFYPQTLNPTVRLHAGDTVAFGGLTDSVVSDENQGKVDRSNCCYRPDIAYHMEEILKTRDSTALEKCNIWFLILASEQVPAATVSSAQQDYYNQLAYMNYYSSMMNGGDYNYYGNYYNYNMLNSYYSSAGQSYTTTDLVDPYRYYNARLTGTEPPGTVSGVPVLTFTYTLMDRHNAKKDK